MRLGAAWKPARLNRVILPSDHLSVSTYPWARVPPRPDVFVPARPDLLFRSPAPSRAGRSPRWGRVVAIYVVLALASGSVAFGVKRSTQHAGYSFIASSVGQPFRWNPCEPIHYVINPRNAPVGWLQDVTAVASRVNAATGIRLVYDGSTDESPSPFRAPFEPNRYGERWAPVLVAWIHIAAGDREWQPSGQLWAGVSTPQLPSDKTGDVYVSGWVVINADLVRTAGFGEPGDDGPVLQHEFGHVVGLGHVNELGEMMNAWGGGMTDWGPGDLAGLAKLGLEAGCLQTPPVP